MDGPNSTKLATYACITLRVRRSRRGELERYAAVVPRRLSRPTALPLLDDPRRHATRSKLPRGLPFVDDRPPRAPRRRPRPTGDPRSRAWGRDGRIASRLDRSAAVAPSRLRASADLLLARAPALRASSGARW